MPKKKKFKAFTLVFRWHDRLDVKEGVVAPGFCSFVNSGRNKHRGGHGMRSTALLGERSDGEDILFKLYSRRPFFSEEGSQFQIVFVGDVCLRMFVCVWMAGDDEALFMHLSIAAR